MKKEFTNLSLRLSHEAQVHIPVNPKRVYLLMHGYQLDGKFIFDKLIDSLPKDSAIIAPNGPFMVPVKKRDEFSAKFAWYFFDPKKQSYYINFEPAANFLKSMLIEMDLFRKPITVIGYSQGGYLAPKIAEIIPAVDTVIGLACCFRNNRFEFRQNVILNQINSMHDLVVDYEGAKAEFTTLRERGNLGQFITLENVGHRLDENYIKELKLLI
jgi:predicted esterase